MNQFSFIFSRRRSFCRIAIVIAMLCANAQAEWQNALKPKGKPAREFVLVRKGKPAAGILCHDSAPHGKQAVCLRQACVT